MSNSKGNSKFLSGKRLLLVSAVSLIASLAGLAAGPLIVDQLTTTPTWQGPAIFMAAIALGLVGVATAPAVVRYLRAKRQAK